MMHSAAGKKKKAELVCQFVTQVIQSSLAPSAFSDELCQQPTHHYDGKLQTPNMDPAQKLDPPLELYQAF